MVSILAYAEQNWDMSQDDVHKLMDQIKDFIKKRSIHPKCPYIEKYPETADELPDNMRAICYADGELPPMLDIPDLSVILRGSKMRGRRQNVKEPVWLAGVPAQYKQMILENLKKSAPASGHVKHEPTGDESPTPLLPSADLLRIQCRQAIPRESRPSLALAPSVRSPSPTADDSGDGESDDAPVTACDIIGLESAFVKAAQDNASRKKKGGAPKAPPKPPAKPKASMKSVKKAVPSVEKEPKKAKTDVPHVKTELKKDPKKVKKEPKKIKTEPKKINKEPKKIKTEPKKNVAKKKVAKAEKVMKAQVLKKPAAAARPPMVVLMKDIFVRLRERARLKNITRAQFVSIAYHGAVKISKRDGKSEADSKEAGRAAHKVAGELYEELSA